MGYTTFYCFQSGLALEETGLVTVVSNLFWEMNKGSTTLLILLDLSLAFDIVAHQIFD